MDKTYGLKEWTEFFALADSTTIPTETIDDMTAAAVSSDWRSGPVEALLPEVVPEFAAISTRLGDAYNREDDSRRVRLLRNTTPTLFRLGCDFGGAMEALQEAREREDLDEERFAHRNAKAIWACIAVFAEDWR